jgi:hypothetical protein
MIFSGWLLFIILQFFNIQKEIVIAEDQIIERFKEEWSKYGI